MNGHQISYTIHQMLRKIAELERDANSTQETPIAEREKYTGLRCKVSISDAILNAQKEDNSFSYDYCHTWRNKKDNHEETINPEEFNEESEVAMALK